MSALINGQVLRAVREAKGWNQQALARQAGIDKSVVSRLEREMQDDLRVSVLLAIATALEIPVAELLSSGHHESGRLIPQLSALLTQIAALPDLPQRQITAILQGYLSVLPDDN